MDRFYMGKLKIGIILQSECLMTQGNNNYSDLLDELGIEDTYENQKTKFVRAQLKPHNNEWWTNPDTWEFIIDRAITPYTPDWFNNDEEKYIANFRESVKAWWREHVFVDKKIDELSSGYYMLKRCEVNKICNDVRVLLCDESHIHEMMNNSCINKMMNNSLIDEMYHKSTVLKMCDKCVIYRMFNNSSIQCMFMDSLIQEMHDYSSIKEMNYLSSVLNMYEHSLVYKLTDTASIKNMYNNSSVTIMSKEAFIENIFGDSVIEKMIGHSSIQTIIGGKPKILKMFDCSLVLSMYGSFIDDMYGNSIAIDCKNEVIHVSPKTDFMLKIHNNNK